MALKWNGDAVKSHFLAAADHTKKAMAELIAERAHQLCPKDTHALANSIGVIESNLGDVYVVVCREYYAPFVEFGYHHHMGGWVPGRYFMTRAIIQASEAFPEIALRYFSLGSVRPETSFGQVGVEV